ncbi:class I SAM-dependent methyltransferase [Candidatus Electronema sp. JM]|uniref:class I SAM-dependent methyltransferase n=1 Tax=Candidatus Electronema sp. JM TaxID=3401571 RepID=UPI003AA95F37
MELTNRDCSVCNSIESVKIYHQKHESIAALDGAAYFQTIVVCKKCGFVYSNPSPADDELTKHYSLFSNYENHQRQGRASVESLNRWQRTYKLISNCFPEKYSGKVLDVGCATATGLSVFKSEGWTVLGIDPSEIAANIARRLYNIEVINGMFDNQLIAEKGPFDVIILSHVLEHLLSPESILIDIEKNLASGGLIYIEVPNLLRPFVPIVYFSFEHLNYFTPSTLSLLMERVGFSVEVELFDNSKNIEPYYPVISAICRKSQDKKTIARNDYEVVCKVIEEYKKNKFQVSSKIISKINYIKKNSLKSKLAIWGAGIHTSQLLSIVNLTKEDVLCIFDNDPKKHGGEISGINITEFSKPELLSKQIDSIIISSNAFEDEIFNQIKYIQEYGIKVYKLYDE